MPCSSKNIACCSHHIANVMTPCKNAISIFSFSGNCSQKPIDIKPLKVYLGFSTGTTHIYNSDEWPFIYKFIVYP